MSPKVSNNAQPAQAKSVQKKTTPATPLANKMSGMAAKAAKPK